MDSIQGRLVSAYYRARDKKTPLLLLCIRVDYDTKKIVEIASPIRPYFVVTRNLLEKSREVALEFEPDIVVKPTDWNHATKHGELFKVEMWNPKHVGYTNKKLKRQLDESDIPYLRRVLIDLGIYTNVVVENKKIKKGDGDIPYPRILYVDCECDERFKIKRNIDFESSRILVIASVDDEGEKRKFNYKSEKQTLLNFAAYASQYDLLVYYAMDKFDEDLIKTRSRIVNLGFDWRQVRFVNLCKLHKKMMSRIQRGEIGSEERGEQFSWSLEYIIEQEGLDVEKITIPGGKFFDCWLRDPDLLERRCINDALALNLLENKHEHIKHHIRVADLCGLFADEATYETPVVDALVLRASRLEKPRLIWPSKESKDDHKRYKGAIVYEPKPGVHRNVLSLDLTSLYNRIIQTFGISPEVYKSYMKDRENFDLDDFIRFSVSNAKENGLPIFPRLLNWLEFERTKYKNLRKENSDNKELHELYDGIQYAYKVILLIFYGILGYSGARMYIRDVARSIPYMGVKTIEKTKDRLENFYVKEISYGDTDSTMIEFPEIDDPQKLYSIGKAIVDDLNLLYNEWLETEYSIPTENRKIEIKFEKIYRRLLFVEAKKKYGFHKVWDEDQGFCDETGVVGLESIKADFCQYAKRLQREITEMIVRDNVQGALIHFKEAKKRLFDGKYDPSELIISEGLGKDLDKYQLIDMHVRAARKYLNLTGRLPDDGRIRFVITDAYKKPRVHPVIEGEIPKINPSGLKYYWDRQIAPASIRVLKAAGFCESDIMGIKKLGEFSRG
ncbi:MAG: DNA polymerase domain-containing protein [Candidatus Thorarchaeota archaeon]